MQVALKGNAFPHLLDSLSELRLLLFLLSLWALPSVNGGNTFVPLLWTPHLSLTESPREGDS